MVDDAMALFSKMIVRAVPPDDVTYNGLIHAFCNDRNLDEANKLLRHMVQCSISINRFDSSMVFVINWVVNSFSKLCASGVWCFAPMSLNGRFAYFVTLFCFIFHYCIEKFE